MLQAYVMRHNLIFIETINFLQRLDLNENYLDLKIKNSYITL
jgi:hypothetical protein